jgi:phosphatidylinositol glycan class V
MDALSSAPRRSSRLSGIPTSVDLETGAAGSHTPPAPSQKSQHAALPAPRAAYLRLVVGFAVITRVAVWLLGVAARAALGAYDTCLETADARVHAAPTTTLDHAVRFAVEPFAHWDGQHFAAIAQAGYEYEKNYAFFPFVPLLMRASSEAWRLLAPGALGAYYAGILGGFVAANAAFVAAAALFLHLSVAVLRDEALALRAALLFCLTPAAVFMSAVYTESFFACFSFAGLLCLVRGRHALAALCFAATCAVRSNGSLFVGFFVLKALHELAKREVPFAQARSTGRIILCLVIEDYLPPPLIAAMHQCSDMNEFLVAIIM